MTTMQTRRRHALPRGRHRGRREVPAIHIWRDFAATPAQLFRAHTDPELFAQWIGPDDVGADIDPLGRPRRRRLALHRARQRRREDFETAFRGCFHTVREDRIVQTFTWEGMPDGVALETMTFEDLGDGRTRLHAVSLCDSFEAPRRLAAQRHGDRRRTTATPRSTACSPTARSDGTPDDPAARHAAVAGGFGRLVAQTRDWDGPGPRRRRGPPATWCDHLVELVPRLPRPAAGSSCPPAPRSADDPVAAWQHHADAVQALLETQRGDETFTHPHAGTHRLADAVDQFYTADVFMHSWDLARAGGQDAGLDEDFAAQLLEGMRPIEQLLRDSGQYGPAVPVPDDAPVVDRLMGFVGRDPAWSPRDGGTP